MANQSINISQQTLDEIKNRFENGLSNKLEFLEAETQLNRDKIILLNKQEQLELNKNKLNEILNIKEKIVINDNQLSKISRFWTVDNNKSQLAALNNNYELKIKQKNIEILLAL